MTQTLRDIDHIRRAPGMYLGGTDFFGFIQYVVSAFDLLLDHGATWIEFEITDILRLSSDALVPTRLNDRGELEPFEAPGKLQPRRIPDAMIVTALSESLRVFACDGATDTVLVCECGERRSFEQSEATTFTPSTRLEFTPDDSIFTVTEVSPAVVHSYCKRTACLHPGVLFRVKISGEVTEYRSTEGIRDFFSAITTPYQLLHKPIHFRETDGDLFVEAVFAFHSWTENRIWSFSNKGRVPDGGTHEAGFLDAIGQLNNRNASSVVGVLAVLAIEYPHVTYEGCIKGRVGNPELRERVSNLVAKGLHQWFRENAKEVEYLETIERFQFANAW